MRGRAAGSARALPGGSGGPGRLRTVDLAGVPALASQDAKGAPADLLGDYLLVLSEMSATGRRLRREELETRRAVGVRAAERGVPLRVVIDLYLSATWLAWPLLPGVRRARGITELRSLGEKLFRAADASVSAIAEGYEGAQRRAIRQEEAQRREFIDDLLNGHRDLGMLAERAQQFGLRLAGAHVVAAAEAEQPFAEGDPVARRVERALLSRFGSRDLLVTTKEGLLLCLTADDLTDVPDQFASEVEKAIGNDTGWRVAIGRAHSGPGGVVRSFEQARSALEFARQLKLEARVLRAADLLVFQVLFRDRAALAELVTAVLGPLAEARGGARPLLDTLSAYFSAGSVATVAARRLQIGTRTVTYRLDRIKALTGYSPDDSMQRFALEVAVLGAQLLDWPEVETPRERA
ncbi:helix-turn-helix domain-containing protein [Actinopolymorpha sp. B17G11]|uniref:PucR family transcriptional regulator n=1 Tax=unclassified Actinopolymorpha TaxID=2627063 RepID=UPI0032D97CF2